MSTAAAPVLHALVVAQAGPGVGLGHLSRALVVARALQRRLGAEIQLLVQGEPLQRADLQVFSHHFVAAEADLPAAISALLVGQPPGSPRVLTLDLQPQRVPAMLPQALQGWRESGCRVVAIDGLLALRLLLDLVFIPSFHFSPPPGLFAAGANIRHGWDCLLLDPLPADQAAEHNEHRAPWQPGHRVLALTGGSDASGLGRHWPALLDNSLPIRSQLHWVTGPYAPPPKWPSQTRIAMHQHLAPAGLGPLMDSCQYAVTVYGVSLFELLQRGVPTVVFSPYGARDDAELAGIAAAGLALVAADAADATRQLVALMGDDARAAALSRAARHRLQRSGADTLAQAVALLCGLTSPSPINAPAP